MCSKCSNSCNRACSLRSEAERRMRRVLVCFSHATLLATHPSEYVCSKRRNRRTNMFWTCFGPPQESKSSDDCDEPLKTSFQGATAASCDCKPSKQLVFFVQRTERSIRLETSDARPASTGVDATATALEYRAES